MEKSYSLHQFNQLIRETLQREFQGEYWVVAEIGDLKVNQSGHCYMDLVEKSNNRILAKSRAVIWASTYVQLGPWFEAKTGEKIKAGMKVMASIRVNFHEIYGLSFSINHLDPSFTMGERARRRGEVLRQLQEEQLLDRNKSLNLPLVPLNVAIISSSTAAGYEDFKQELMNNSFGYAFDSVLYSALLQGDDAIPSLLKALNQAGSNPAHDVIVIIRGGGSQLDLDVFDSYALGSAIATMNKPVLTGIGHDRDETVVDLVSYKKLKTPTATAQFLVERVARFEEQLIEEVHRIKSKATKTLATSKEHLASRRSMLRLSAVKILELAKSNNLAHSKNLQFLANNRMIAAMHKIDLLKESLKQHDPEMILDKGYSISTVNGIPTAHVEKFSAGDSLLTVTKKHKITSIISKSESRNGR